MASGSPAFSPKKSQVRTVERDGFETSVPGERAYGLNLCLSPYELPFSGAQLLGLEGAHQMKWLALRRRPFIKANTIQRRCSPRSRCLSVSDYLAAIRSVEARSLVQGYDWRTLVPGRRGTGSWLTQRWSGMDSNFQFRAR
jgi:hypothetical protein